MLTALAILGLDPCGGGGGAGGGTPAGGTAGGASGTNDDDHELFARRGSEGLEPDQDAQKETWFIMGLKLIEK